jgi:hypothetical protein
MIALKKQLHVKELFGRRRHQATLAFFSLTLIALLIAFTAGGAEAAIAKITSVKGAVIVNQAGNVSDVTAPGLALNDGDQLLTKEGEAQVTFNDGAILKMQPYTKAMIQERKETKGTIFKTKENARRLTCYTGKFWFKSGASKTKNYLQSPTAVAGLRGTDADFGFNPERMQTLLNMYSGQAAVIGNVIRGFFQNPGVSAAQKSQVYQNLEKAYAVTVETKKANENPALTQEQKTINTAAAKVEALQVVEQAAQILVQTNPDPVVKTQAQATSQVVTATITTVKIQEQVAKTEIIRQAAVQEVQKAQAAGDTQKAAEAQKVVQQATVAVRQEQQAARQAEQRVQQAVTLLAVGNVTAVAAQVQQVQQIEQRVQQQAQQVEQAAQQVVTTVATTLPTTIATTIATTVAATAETTAATTAATTTATTAATTAETTTTSVATTIPLPTSSTSSSTSSFATTTSPK